MAIEWLLYYYACSPTNPTVVNTDPTELGSGPGFWRCFYCWNCLVKQRNPTHSCWVLYGCQWWWWDGGGSGGGNGGDTLTIRPLKRKYNAITIDWAHWFCQRAVCLLLIFLKQQTQQESSAAALNWNNWDHWKMKWFLNEISIKLSS